MITGSSARNSGDHHMTAMDHSITAMPLYDQSFSVQNGGDHHHDCQKPLDDHHATT